MAKPGQGKPKATVVVVTRNRREELLSALRSAAAQRPPVEVIVVDDGSTDGTAEAVAGAFPSVRVVHYEESLGLIVRRNAAAELISTPIMVSIDDDAEFTSPAAVATTLAEFSDPRVGAVAIPYVDVPSGDAVLQRAPSAEDIFVTNVFRGTAYAVRRDTFTASGAFRAMLFQQAEEPDFCLRLLERGLVVRLGRADPVLHHGSPRRDLDRMWFYTCRNAVLFAWHNVPAPYLLRRLLKVSLHHLALGIGVRRPGLFVRGLAAGFRAIGAERRRRRPVSRRTWRLYLRLERHPARLEEIAHLLPAVGR